jgi:rubredoxin
MLTDPDFVEFLETGDDANGRYQCSDCGYGVTIRRELPICPMCGGTIWESQPIAVKPRLQSP